MREDDQCAAAMGLNVVRLKIVAFGTSCFFAGVAGALLAHTANFISPDQFQFGESINVLAMVVVGGLGSLPGGVIGALLLIILPEALRPVGDFRMIAIGSVMLFSILLLPRPARRGFARAPFSAASSARPRTAAPGRGWAGDEPHAGVPQPHPPLPGAGGGRCRDQPCRRARNWSG